MQADDLALAGMRGACVLGPLGVVLEVGDGALARHFGSTLPVHGSDAGLHVVLGLPAGSDDQALVQRIEQAGVASRPLSLYHLRKAGAAPGLVLGYGGVDHADFARHFATLASIVQARL